jgi:hypothetical protein
MQQEFDTVGCILPNQMRVRMSRRREIRSVGCILPRMFLVPEGEKLALHQDQIQSGEGIFNPFRFINPSLDQKKVLPSVPFDL